ncbi:MAG: hypothetical protein ABFC24_02720 [Methanoregulaceae archaeon]
MMAVVGENPQIRLTGATADYAPIKAGRFEDLMVRLQVEMNEYFHSPRLNTQYGGQD